MNVCLVSTSVQGGPLWWGIGADLDRPPVVAAEQVGFEPADLYVALKAGAYRFVMRGDERRLDLT